MKAMTAYLFLVSCLIALSYSASVTELTANQVYNGVIDSNVKGLDLQYFKVWVPKNALTVEVNLQYNSSTCGLSWYLRRLGLPCPPVPPYVGPSTICNGDSIVSSESQTYAPINITQFNTDWYWYFGVGRTQGSTIDSTCNFGFSVNIYTCSGADQIDGYGQGDQTICTTVHGRVIPFSETLQNIDTAYAYNISIPENVGNVTIVVTSPNRDLFVAAVGNASPTASNTVLDSLLTVSNSTSDPSQVSYVAVVTAPRVGQLNIMIINRDAFKSLNTLFNATISVSWAQCDGVTYGGANCGSRIYTNTYDLIQVNQPTYTTSIYRYQLPSMSVLNITIVLDQSSRGYSGQALFRTGAYPYDRLNVGFDSLLYANSIEYSKNGYNTFTLFGNDLYDDGTHYLAVITTGAPILYTVYSSLVNVTYNFSTTTTTSISTTTSIPTTTTTTTTSSTSTTSTSTTSTSTTSATPTSARVSTTSGSAQPLSNQMGYVCMFALLMILFVNV